jgi:hypothetical protein
MRKQYLRTILLLLVAYSSFAANDLRIYQIYGGGGNSEATYANDFIVLYNNNDLSSINLNTYSIQYASATSSNWKVKPLSGSIPANGFYLIEIVTDGVTGATLPTADLVWSDLGNDGVSQTAGKVALMSNLVALDISTLPSNAIDFVGYGSSASAYEGTKYAPAINSTECIVRINDGQDTDENSVDFIKSDDASPSTVRPSNSTSFPVKLVFLDVAKYGESAILDWKTSEELNFSHFEIQKSKDAVGFESIGKVSSNKGLSSTYNFVDNQPAPGVNYYRLKMVDLDGKIEYSKINSINFASELNVVLYPNPSSDFVKLNNINLKEISQVTVSDIQGKVLKVFNENFDTMPINELQSQYYIIRVYASTGKLYSYKLLKI